MAPAAYRRATHDEQRCLVIHNPQQQPQLLQHTHVRAHILLFSSAFSFCAACACGTFYPPFFSLAPSLTLCSLRAPRAIWPCLFCSLPRDNKGASGGARGAAAAAAKKPVSALFLRGKPKEIRRRSFPPIVSLPSFLLTPSPSFCNLNELGNSTRICLCVIEKPPKTACLTVDRRLPPSQSTKLLKTHERAHTRE